MWSPPLTDGANMCSASDSARSSGATFLLSLGVPYRPRPIMTASTAAEAGSSRPSFPCPSGRAKSVSRPFRLPISVPPWPTGAITTSPTSSRNPKASASTPNTRKGNIPSWIPPSSTRSSTVCGGPSIPDTAREERRAWLPCRGSTSAQNPRGADNSVFICFAPRENPKIAIAAYLENAGFGATWAAPIASLMIEKYLTGEISESRKPLEQRVLEGDLMSRVKKD